ncbi:MAG: aminoglycoside phosphotransferase family protein [Bacteroidales bacterium]|jgi:Ser/Thr protein kinase RdoA (MazF antagonist)|nr:aminoglycoside phosphotransferase family protein [Bacteroidales bacterium]
MRKSPDEIFSMFRVPGSKPCFEPFGNGHIHDTWAVSIAEKEGYEYIIQRLNHNVFRNIPGLQENIERVTEHIRNGSGKTRRSGISGNSLTLIPANDGKSWIKDDNGDFWRMYLFIRNHRSYNIVDTPEKAFEGGRAIGQFQFMLSDLPGKPLNETIPWFHNIEKRLGTFFQVLGKDICKRASVAADEINFVTARTEKMTVIEKAGREGSIPLRITHNDTKFNNILFDTDDRALCLIDLDTVMQGYVHYDFGDSIRTAASSAAEDEKDLSKVRVKTDLFEGFARGYISETRDFITSEEKELLAIAPQVITYTMAVRFLTDSLDGDHYYKIRNPEHNLQRARAQLKLVESMEQEYGVMASIIKRL